MQGLSDVEVVVDPVGLRWYVPGGWVSATSTRERNRIKVHFTYADGTYYDVSVSARTGEVLRVVGRPQGYCEEDTESLEQDG